MRKITIIRLAALCLLAVIAGGMLCGCAPKEEKEKLFAYAPKEGKAFQTNISGSKKILQTEIVIELSQEKMINTFTDQDYKVCDAVLMELRTITEDQLGEPDIREKIGQELINKINEVMDTDTVRNVYFKSFVVA